MSSSARKRQKTSHESKDIDSLGSYRTSSASAKVSSEDLYRSLYASFLPDERPVTPEEFPDTEEILNDPLQAGPADKSDPSANLFHIETISNNDLADLIYESFMMSKVVGNNEKLYNYGTVFDRKPYPSVTALTSAGPSGSIKSDAAKNENGAVSKAVDRKPNPSIAALTSPGPSGSIKCDAVKNENGVVSTEVDLKPNPSIAPLTSPGPSCCGDVVDLT